MIKSFRHKGLQRFFEKGSKSGIQAQHERRLRLMLSRLDDVTRATDMDAPGWKLHALKGGLKGHWAVCANSGACRSTIPPHVGPPFRLMGVQDSG